MVTTVDVGSALLGGALIGLSATLLALLIGRVAGIAGIVAETVSPAGVERRWRLAFLAGLVTAPWLLSALGRVPATLSLPSWPWLLGGGFLVGVGTRLAGGCTSGHGICGNARLSPRSVVATLTFIAAGVLVVALVRHGLEVSP